MRASPPVSRFALPIATAVAVALAVALAIRAVWRAPLNVDEELTRRVATEPFGAIFHIVSSERGGGPVHFWLEHFTLQWPGGLGGLRGPSLLFFALTLPAIALIARELAGSFAAVGGGAADGGRPARDLLLDLRAPARAAPALLEWGTVLGLRAARSGRHRDWIAAGAVLGASVFVHPTAPVYSLTAFAAVLLYTPRPARVVVREAWPGAVALAVTFVPYYVKTLGVLERALRHRSRREAGPDVHRPPGLAATRSTPLAPVPHLLNWFTAAALVGLVALVADARLARRRRARADDRAPIVFFSVVPANGLSALFFDRYMLPALPSFLILVAVACAAIAARAGRARSLVLGLLLVGPDDARRAIVLARQRQLEQPRARAR